jgi:hypothetical protein
MKDRMSATGPEHATQVPRDDAAVDEIVRRGPAGAFAVVGVATAVVVLIFFVFYLLVYLPRGVIQ